MPGYLVAVIVILTLMPDTNANLTVWLANLTLTQIYVPLTLTTGLTQMWSLSVEVCFYIGTARAGAAGPAAAGGCTHPGRRSGWRSREPGGGG